MEEDELRSYSELEELSLNTEYKVFVDYNIKSALERGFRATVDVGGFGPFKRLTLIPVEE